MNGQDFWNAISFGGASLVQVYSAFVQKGSTPNLPYYLTADLTRGLKEVGVKNVKELIGIRANYPFPKTH